GVMDHELRRECREIAARAGCEVEVKEFWYFPPTPFDAAFVGAVRDAAARLGFPHMDIISGAGHDAVYMARVAPTGMIFVPCKGAISHNEIEAAHPAALEKGCAVLLQTVLEQANRRSDIPSPEAGEGI